MNEKYKANNKLLLSYVHTENRKGIHGKTILTKVKGNGKHKNLNRIGII